MSQLLNKEFGPFRSFFWPIHMSELRKLLPMILILFLICFNYSILRNMKDSLVITSLGAEVIPFIKVWVMLPIAVLLTYFFTRLSNRFSQERVFYMMISFFLAFFALFAFVLYPIHDLLHPTELASSLQSFLPAGFKGFINMCCHWSFTTFYVMSELWSTMILTIGFWGFANEVTNVQEARRFYGVLGIAASIAAAVAGQSANFISEGTLFKSFLPATKDAWEGTIIVLITLIIISGLVTIILFRWVNKKVLVGDRYEELHHLKKLARGKERLSLRKSILLIWESKYLLCIAILVIAYNLVINMSEVTWKDQLARIYSNPNDYNKYMNNLTSIVGILATIAALFMAKIIEKLGWTWTAMITPIMMLVTCAGFFAFLLLPNTWIALSLGASPLVIASVFGAAQNCLSKASKYSVFDATKEMAFIPLDHETKLKGKAAIDGVGSRLGKSGGSIMYQGLLMLLASISASVPYVACILICVIVLWMIAVYSLGKQFNQLTQLHEKESTSLQNKASLQISSEATSS